MKKFLLTLSLFFVLPLHAELKPLPNLVYYPHFHSSAFLTATNVTIDATGEKQCWILNIPSTETIRKIGWGNNTITTGDSLEFRIEDITRDGTGVCSGNLYATNSSGTINILSTDDNIWDESNAIVQDVVINSTRPVGIVIQSTGSAFNGTITAKLTSMGSFNYYASSVNGAAYARVTGADNVGLIRTDGSYVNIPGVDSISLNASNTVAYNITTNPNTRAALFSLPFRARAIGFWAFMAFNNVTTTEFELQLISSTPTVINEVTIGSSTYISGAGLQNLDAYPFQTPFIFEANVNYRMAIKSMGANNLTLNDAQNVNSTADKVADPGPNWILSTANNPTKESDWTNTSTRHPLIGLIIDAIDDGQQNGGMGVLFQ